MTPDELNAALINAITTRNAEAVRDCLAKGADPNAVNPSDGAPVLVWAAKCRWVEGVEILAAAGADLNWRDQRLGADLETPLMLMAAWGYPDVFEALIQAGSDHTLLNRHGRTALDLAAFFERQHEVPLATFVEIQNRHVQAQHRQALLQDEQAPAVRPPRPRL